MKRFLILVFIVLFSGSALAQDISADLSVHEIEVTVGFSGSNLLVFGAIKRKADVVVVVKGPPVYAKLWAKRLRGVFWVNDRPLNYESIPGFYAIASSKPLADIVDSKTAEEYGLTLAALKLTPEESRDSVLTDNEGLKSVQREKSLYQEIPNGVKISAGGLFRADFRLPAALPVGDYKAHIYLLRNGKVIAEQDVPLGVSHAGIEATINHLAHERPFTYAFLALALSLVWGGGGAYLFRKRA